MVDDQKCVFENDHPNLLTWEIGMQSSHSVIPKVIQARLSGKRFLVGRRMQNYEKGQCGYNQVRLNADRSHRGGEHGKG
jgi:hypothetical protein